MSVRRKRSAIQRPSSSFPYYLTRTPETLDGMLQGVVDLIALFEGDLHSGHPTVLLLTALECEEVACHALEFAHAAAQSGPARPGGAAQVNQKKLEQQQKRFNRMLDRARESKGQSPLEVHKFCFEPVWHLRQALKTVDWFRMSSLEAQRYAVLLDQFLKRLHAHLPRHWLMLRDQYRRDHDLLGVHH